MIKNKSIYIEIHSAIYIVIKLFEQNIDGLKRSLSTKSRRMSRITEIALVTIYSWIKHNVSYCLNNITKRVIVNCFLIYFIRLKINL